MVSRSESSFCPYRLTRDAGEYTPAEDVDSHSQGTPGTSLQVATWRKAPHCGERTGPHITIVPEWLLRVMELIASLLSAQTTRCEYPHKFKLISAQVTTYFEIAMSHKTLGCSTANGVKDRVTELVRDREPFFS